MTITFFGHRDAPESVKPILKKIILNLINEHKAKMFYVGNNGAFDDMVIQALSEIKKDFPKINFFVVLAYMPKDNTHIKSYIEHTVYPEELAFVPKRYAIIKRNIWMIEHADTIITFVNNPFGKATHFKNVAEKKGKNIINICSYITT